MSSLNSDLLVEFERSNRPAGTSSLLITERATSNGFGMICSGVQVKWPPDERFVSDVYHPPGRPRRGAGARFRTEFNDGCSG